MVYVTNAWRDQLICCFMLRIERKNKHLGVLPTDLVLLYQFLVQTLGILTFEILIFITCFCFSCLTFNESLMHQLACNINKDFAIWSILLKYLYTISHMYETVYIIEELLLKSFFPVTSFSFLKKKSSYCDHQIVIVSIVQKL